MGGIFISYRRNNISTVRQIHDRIVAAFGKSDIFFDQTAIRPGSDFPDAIGRGLDCSDIVLAIIGPTWTTVQHEKFKKRRLDIRNDWVRVEIARSLEEKKVVIPVLIEGARIPEKDELPNPLKPLVRCNAVSLDERHFAEDLNALVEVMRSEIVAHKVRGFDDDDNPFPRPRVYAPRALDEAEQKLALGDLPRWQIGQAKESISGIELKRTFKFPSFRAAIRFMNEASKRIEPYDHHPRWENIYETIWVGLSTWDSGHAISDRDYKTALMLERLYQEFLRDH